MPPCLARRTSSEVEWVATNSLETMVEVCLFLSVFLLPSHKILKVVAFLRQVGTTCKAAVSLVPTPRAPPSEKRSGERVKFLGLIPQNGGSPMRL